jgi:hypothetical protein
MPAGAAPDREPPRKTPAPTPELLVDEGSSHEALVRIQRIGIYHTSLLVNRADEVFAADVLDRLSERTRAEMARGRTLPRVQSAHRLWIPSPSCSGVGDARLRRRQQG